MNCLKKEDLKEKRTKGPNWTKEEDDYLRNNSDKTVKELSEKLGRTINSIRNRKNVIGVKRGNCPLFTPEEKDIIYQWYVNDEGVDLEALSRYLNRPKTSISKVANDMGLTRYGNYTKNERKKRSESMVHNISKVEHSKGMLGKRHTEETKTQLSLFQINRYKSMSNEEKHNIAMKSVETRRKNGTIRTTTNAYSHCKRGKRSDLNQFFRSAWEANIARLLNYYNIQWKYEYKRFDFYNETSGVLSYQPDFYLPQTNEWIEVKGWMDNKSIKRMELFAQYYPDENKNLYLIDQNKYKIINELYKAIIPNWE